MKGLIVQLGGEHAVTLFFWPEVDAMEVGMKGGSQVDSARVKALPKLEFHVHLEGTVAASPDGQSFTDFDSFLTTFGQLTFRLATLDDFRRAVIAYGRRLVGDGGVYAEVTLTLSTHVHKKGLDPEAVMQACWAGAKQVERETGAIIRFVLDHVRNHSAERGDEVLEWCVAFRDLGVVALGLGGQERGYPASRHDRMLRRAQRLGVPFVPHAGEAAGPEQIRDALSYEPRRIGHAVSAWLDPRLPGELAHRGIMIEACPTSNLRLGHVRSLAEHPLRRYVVSGIPLSVNTDNPAMFSTSLLREYVLAIDMLGCTETMLRELNARAVDHVLAGEDVRRRLAALV
ncbi:adenosine deaminase family protein [Nonomuraea sp. NPDC004297]